jgi:YggT family protein
MALTIQIINLLAELVTLLVVIKVILSYVMSPYHPVRQTIDSFLEPMLGPIRRLIPPTGMFDFSPIVLVLAIQLIARILIGFLSAY